MPKAEFKDQQKYLWGLVRKAGWDKAVPGKSHSRFAAYLLKTFQVTHMNVLNEKQMRQAIATLKPYAKRSLYPYQLRFLGDGARWRIVNKSRQIGFSYVAALDCLVGALVRERNQLVVSASILNAEVVLDYIRMHLENMELLPNVDKNGLIELPNGKEIRVLSTNWRTARSFNGDVLRAGKDKYERLLRDKPRIGRDYGPFNARPTRAELEQEREEMVAQYLKRLEEEDYGRRLDSARKEPKIHEILEGALGPLGMGEPAKKEVE